MVFTHMLPVVSDRGILVPICLKLSGRNVARFNLEFLLLLASLVILQNYNIVCGIFLFRHLAMQIHDAIQLPQLYLQWNFLKL